MNALQWPALDLQGAALPERLEYERAIWGKVHGAASDYRWIATTPAFNGRRARIERELSFGVEDAPATFTAWRVRGSTCYAVSCYRSSARDASGRSGFLEKQIVEWERPPAIPAALAALLLLPLAATFGTSIDGEPWNDARWVESEFSLDLGADAHRPLPVAGVEETIEKGLHILRSAVTQEKLSELYAALLAGGRAVPLHDASEALPPEALAALLLPLPRNIADELSMTAWLPSTQVTDSDGLRRRWNVIAAGKAKVTSPGVTPDAEQIERGRLMASCVFEGDPSPLLEASGTATSPIRLMLWGPSAAGKTVLLANLYLQTDHDWAVFPTEKSLEFIHRMRSRMYTSNFFPIATTIGHVEGIEYLFRHHRTGLSASLALEDRSGSDWEERPDETSTTAMLTKRLATADGLVLLFDPVTDQATLEARVWRTLELVHVASRRGVQKDDRPIAVCVSKADVLIETAEDFRCAVETPDLFVRKRVPAVMIQALERFCSDFKLFPVSAAGVRLRHGVVEPAVFFDESLEPRICPGGRAFNLMTPFAWLLNRLTEART